MWDKSRLTQSVCQNSALTGKKNWEQKSESENHQNIENSVFASCPKLQISIRADHLLRQTWSDTGGEYNAERQGDISQAAAAVGGHQK